MMRIICKCKECDKELEASLPAINSTGDIMLEVEKCDCSPDEEDEES